MIRHFGMLIPSTNTTVEIEYNRLLPETLQVHVGRLGKGGDTPFSPSLNADVDYQSKLLGTARVDSCDISEKWATSFRGLASYTIPKIDLLVSASMRSLETTPGGGVATNGLSLAANYVVPNTMIQQSLGRLPANALATGTTTVNLLKPGELYTLNRINLVDMRFAKILRFAGRRADVGVDLYNLFNSNVTTSYQQTFEQRTNGAAWLTPTAIAAPRLARFHVTLNF